MGEILAFPDKNKPGLSPEMRKKAEEGLAKVIIDIVMLEHERDRLQMIIDADKQAKGELT